eukprot:COSAG02_NODE_14558_length_1260_cov_0.733850_2_plen_95_part_00
MGRLGTKLEEFERFTDGVVADCGQVMESQSQPESELVSEPSVGATVPLLLVDTCSQDDEEPCYSPERIFVERERRERPPRRYDKHGEDTAKSED